MDNPQHYQPLSAALHPPLASRSSAPTYGQSTIVFDASGRPVHESATTSAAGGTREEEEEEEEEHEDEDDEGMIEKELNPRREGGPEHEQVHGHHPTTTAPTTIIQPHTAGQGVLQQQQPERRRPGRPRGSKNRKNRAPPGSTAGPGAPQAAAAPSLPPLPAHADINPQNREYYEFQWKVLHLCREFYEAAEQLVKATHPLVIAQCYGMGPTCKVDPIVMLAESKAVCDALMANPSQLVSNPHPPPPMYPIIPTFYSSNPAANTTPGASTSRQSTALPPSAVITNPQSFVVPLGIHPPSGAFPPPFGVYGAPPPPLGSQYGTPYYGFPPYGHPAPYYHPAASASSAQPAPQPAVAAASTSSTIATSNGPWTDDQVTRLKELVEEAKGGDGQVDWDHVEKNLPGGRSRHQILIKATALGLKENTSRAAKRPRRDQDQGDGGTPMPSLASGSQQQRVDSPRSPASTPSASPALQNLQRPPSTSTSNGGGNGQAGATNPRTSTPATTGVQWAVTTPATQAASTSTGLLHTTPASGAQDPQRTSYYRPRPTSASSKSASEQIHHYQALTATTISFSSYAIPIRLSQYPSRLPGLSFCAISVTNTTPAQKPPGAAHHVYESYISHPMTTPFPTTRSNLSAPPISPMVRSVSLGSQSSSSQPNEPETPVPATPRRASLLSLPSGAGPGGAGGKSRARDLLRRHYGLGVGPPPPSKGNNVSNDPMDLNSPAFDAKSYYEQLITTSTLPMLLKQENELLSEIRQLDSERQSLVYNHHHELIAASDTIGAMKTHAESLESDLDLLRAAFSEISRLSAEVAIEDSQPNSEGQQERRQGQAHDRQ